MKQQTSSSLSNTCFLVGVRVSLAKMETNCDIRVNGTESDCSSLFEGIHPAFTIAQACIALLVVILGVPLNVLIVVALIKYCHLMDEAFMLCVSIFISNVVVSFTMGTNIFLSAATRSWPLGYIGCEVYSFFTYSPIPVRWLTLGMLSIDRFCRIFFPFRYARCSKLVLKVLLILPWIFTLLGSTLTLIKVIRTFYFTTTLPGCFYRSTCQGSTLCTASIYMESTALLGFGSILPIALYTVLYFKSRRIMRADKRFSVTNAQQKADRERQNKATKTFALLLITYSCYSSAVLVIVLLRQIPVVQDMRGLFFILADFTLLHLVTDFLLVWKNENGKHVIKKLINTVLRKRVFDIDSVGSFTPSSTSSQQQSSTDILVPLPPQSQGPTHDISLAVNQTQANTRVPYSPTDVGKEQASTSSPTCTSTANSHQEQLNVDTPTPALISGQEDPATAGPTLCSHLYPEHQETSYST